MSNNKRNVTPIKEHLEAKGKPSNPNEVVAAARAAQEAKTATEKPTEASTEPKEATTASTATNEPKKTRKRLTRSEWVAILDKKEREGLTAAQIAEEHGVTEGNVYQWTSKLKSEAEEEAKKAEAAKLSPSNIVHDAIELTKKIAEKLEAFDKKVEEAQAFVDNADKERKTIKDSKKKYEQIVELLGTDEDKAKLKEVEAEIAKSK